MHRLHHNWLRRFSRYSSPHFLDPPAVLLWLFLGFVLFRYLQGGHRIPALGAIRFEAICGTILLVTALVAGHWRRPVALSGGTSAPAMSGWVGALFVLMLLHVGFSIDPQLSWERFFDRVFKFALFGFLIVSFVTSPRVLRLFLATYLLAFMKMTQEGIVGYFSGSMVWENQGVQRLHGSTPSYHHPNSFGGTQLSVLPFVVGLWANSPKWAKAFLLALGIGALLVTIFTGSRTAYVALLIWMAVYVARSKSRLVQIISLMVAFGTIAIIVPSDYTARFISIFTQEDIEGASIDKRKEIFNDAWTIFTENPLGIGVGMFPVARQMQFGRSQDTHNLYLEVATNLGVFGVVVFVGLIFTIFRTLVYVRRRSDSMASRIIAAPNDQGDLDSTGIEERLRDLNLVRQTADALIGFLVIRLGLGLFGHDLYEIYWWFLAGSTAALVRILNVLEAQSGSDEIDVPDPLTAPTSN